MIYFIDESGQDLRNTPCMVRSGVGISEHVLWNFINSAVNLKRKILAMTTLNEWEPKGSVLLSKRMFKLSSQKVTIDDNDRYKLLRSLYHKNKIKENITFDELSALAQASIEYVERLLDLCNQFKIKVFGTVFPRDGIITKGSELRKDYAYLFERIYWHLQSISDNEKGIIVFDETEKKQSEKLIRQMRKYFRQTAIGRERSKNIIPEPFFVHSDLTTATQLADIIAYIINWGVKSFKKCIIKKGKKVDINVYRRVPTRSEIEPFGKKVIMMQFVGNGLDAQNQERNYFGLVFIKDLRTQFEKKGYVI